MNNFGTDSTTNHAGITLSAEQNDTCTAFTDSIACDSATYCSVVIPEEKEDTSHVSTHMLDHDEGWWADSTYYIAGKTLPDPGMPSETRGYTPGNDSFITGGLLLMFIIGASIFAKFRWILLYKIKEFFSDKRKYSEENINTNSNDITSSLIMTCISTVSAGIICFRYMAEQNVSMPYGEPPYYIIGYISAGGMLYFGIKCAIYAFVNSIFFKKEDCKKWMTSYLLVASLSAFASYPMALASVFTNTSMYEMSICTLFFVILCKILLLYRLFTNFKIRKYGISLIFLYFCAVEIMPIFIIVHVLETTNCNLL